VAPSPITLSASGNINAAASFRVQRRYGPISGIFVFVNQRYPAVGFATGAGYTLNQRSGRLPVGHPARPNLRYSFGNFILRAVGNSTFTATIEAAAGRPRLRTAILLGRCSAGVSRDGLQAVANAACVLPL
jgi:hypothetical protein